MIVGSGFGGMQAAQSLARSGADVLIVDRNNYNTFVPLLYQVATAQIAPEMIAYPIRTILRGRGRMNFLKAEVQQVDFENQVVKTEDAVIDYDYLVLSTGSRPRSLGVEGAIAHTLPLMSLNDAITIRNHLFQCFELASRLSDSQRRKALLTFVIVGGGPTGVEVAGALVELIQSLRRDYSRLNRREVKIVLVQSGDTLLANLPTRLGRYASRKLSKLGVEVLFDTKVSSVSDHSVVFENGSTHAKWERMTETVIWAAGLEAAVVEGADRSETAPKQKLKVRSTLQLCDYDNVYAIGDLSYVEQNGKPLSGVAPEALQQGVTVAKNLHRQLQGRSPKGFSYFNKGRLAIIGGYSGVGKIGPVLLTGFIPWLMWLGVHGVYLPGFRNRLMVLMSWIHNYVLRDRPIRVIIRS
ncbi:Pyridine nucleotide-disulphide oxidoreductase, putative [Synechococcus sp. PCC 7335]|uniref:NAD(P)/FAD-dependent oxidoreductase n=1 Tax=Synechococcus sp. (strain ATCC 29403 / PCC 7335) TaxID=91464 RepID=UPI00017EBC4A|nr:NAD(P)/FAD-dependent oxidoreductase [Synechococcus sp. PCC 7335]EDX83631.1 Pyridine nucleotide-disulphide oxidoreductase, putative [Synechococcus sp. PCC 7335]